MAIRKRQIDTLVFVSNGSWKGYGFFRALEKDENGEYKVKLAAAISSESSFHRRREFVIGSTWIHKVTAMTNADSDQKARYMYLIRRASDHNDKVIMDGYEGIRD